MTDSKQTDQLDAEGAAAEGAGAGSAVEGGEAASGEAAEGADAESAAAGAAGADSAESADDAAEAAGADGKKKKKKLSAGAIVAIVLVVLVVLLVVAYGAYLVIARNFTAQEAVVRTAWKVDTGELTGTNDDTDVYIYEADVDSDMAVFQIEPAEVEDEDFTYYDEDVQERLAETVAALIADSPEDTWEADAPLAILNPYGTGSNGLYLYFETEEETEVSYLIETEGYADYSATAAGGYTTVHELQVIGLVAGETNHVTMTLSDEDGEAVEIVEFDITMPETSSGYDTQLEYTDGESTTELSDGLYALLRTNGYLGYGFFFDNEGVLRYELVLEGFGMDRIVEYDGDIVVCVSDSKIARINGLGQVVSVYDMGEYVLHHDINYGEDGKLLIAAEWAESDEGFVEDLVLELDLETGELSLLLDFTDLMSDYVYDYTRVISLTDGDWAYNAGEWDWIHINSVQYLEEDDSLIVSSRETSTIIKVENIHTDPEIAWLCGNPDFWEGTPYEDLVLDPVGDFTFQYGQHDVEYIGAGDEDGVYYISMYNNNYWALSTRDDYDPDDEDLEGVSSLLFDFTSSDISYVYVYKIDENEGTFELVESFEVPYSSIVSSATLTDVWENYNLDAEGEAYESGTNWVVNSGVSMVFGEYDSDGVLIREFSYEATNQGYRVIKYSFEGFWFADDDADEEEDEEEAEDEEDAEADEAAAEEEAEDEEAAAEDEAAEAEDEAAETSEDAAAEESSDEDASAEEDASEEDASGDDATDDEADATSDDAESDEAEASDDADADAEEES